jgi:methylmalonyl-CoA mutase cobalamin-binding subunit
MEMNRRIGLNQFSISQEHILSALIKEFLSKVRAGESWNTGKSRFILATPEGDFHELGLLVAYTYLQVTGVNVLYIGPNVPKRDLCETVLRYGATHVLITSTLTRGEGAKEDIPTYLNFLDQHFPEKTAIWVAGRGLGALKLGLKRHLRFLTSFQDLRQK